MKNQTRKRFFSLLLSGIILLNSVGIARITHACAGINMRLEAKATGCKTECADAHACCGVAAKPVQSTKSCCSDQVRVFQNPPQSFQAEKHFKAEQAFLNFALPVPGLSTSVPSLLLAHCSNSMHGYHYLKPELSSLSVLRI